MGIENLWGLFGKRPQYGGDTEGLEANFDKTLGPNKKPGFNDPGGLGEKLFRLGAFMRDDPGYYQGLQEMQQRQAILHAQAQQAEAQRLAARREKQWEWENKPRDPYRTEDNAGNVWEIGPDGQKRLLFADQIAKMYIQGDQAIQVPNPFAARGGAGADLPPGYTVRQQPGPSALPDGNVITPEMWQGAVSSLGPQAAEEWRRRNNITVGGR